MLYKVWEATKIPYYTTYADRSGWHACDWMYDAPAGRTCWETIVGPQTSWSWEPTWFGIWTTMRPEEFTMQDGTPTTSLSQVYSFLTSFDTYGYGIHCRIDKFDAATGELIWTHRNPYDMISFAWIYRFNFFNDDTNTVWSQDLMNMGLYEHGEYEDPDGEMAFAPGMPKLNTYKTYYAYNDWLNEAGDGPAFETLIGGIVTAMGVSRQGDWMAMTYMDTDGQALAIHNLSDRRRRGYVRLISKAARGMSVDSQTLYIFTTRMTIEVIDVPRLQHLGELNFGDYTLPSGVTVKMSLGYDRVYRRMLTLIPIPDDPITGCCQCGLEGWALREVAERLTKPIVLQTPREGKSVAVLGRAYGWTGKGVAGEQVTATLLTGDGALNPTRASADANGFVKFLWTPGSPDDPTCDIQLSASVTQAESGLAPPDYQAPLLKPPSTILAEGRQDLFYPGFWLYAPTATRVRTTTAEQALSPYYDDYSWYDEETGETETRENRWRGALVEYSWYELETSADTYNLAKITADLNWAKANHIKLMICIRTTPEVADGVAWIPNYIVDDSTGIYPLSTTCAGKRGIFAPQFSDISLRVCMPMLTDTAVRARLQTLITTITTTYLDDDDFVGVFPLDYPCVDPGAWSVAGIPLSAWYEARRDVLLQSRASIKLVNEWLLPRKEVCNYYDAAHKSWCVTNGVGIVSPKYYLDNYQSSTANAGNAINGAGPAVSTGWALGAETWTTTHNLDCTSSQADFWELIFGGADLLNQSTNCNKKHLDSYLPWQVFVEPASVIWDAGTTGVMTTMDRNRLYREREYYG